MLVPAIVLPLLYKDTYSTYAQPRVSLTLALSIKDGGIYVFSIGAIHRVQARI